MKSSVFLKIGDYVLLEFIYSSELVAPSKFKKYINTASGRIYMVNDLKVNAPATSLATGNVETLMAVDSNSGYMAVVDTNEGFYYPNSNNDIFVSELPISHSLKYDSIKIHLRSGYNFQDSQGLYIDAFMKATNGNKISLLSQSFFKGDLSNIKYNNTPLRISEMTFDKYVEYQILSISEIIRGENNTQKYFNDNILPSNQVENNPIIYFDFSFIDKVDSTSGYVKFYTSSLDSLAVPANDGYNRLEPSLVEKNSFFEYMAMWDGSSVEDFISIMNSKAGNNYHVEHEISVFEQRGYDFFEIHRHTSVQKFGYDKPLRFRPIVSNSVDGSIQIEYVISLFNAGDNTSIVKRTMLNSTNVSAYVEEPMRINVGTTAPIKVYNKVVKKNVSIDNKKFLEPQKILAPIYYSNVAMSIGNSDFMLDLVPFDNIYKIYVNQGNNGQSAPAKLEQTIKYQMVFPLSNGNIVRINENDLIGKLNGVLSYNISQEQARVILASQETGTFYINVVNDVVETNMSIGKWQRKGFMEKPIIDDALTEDVILDNEEPIVMEETIVFKPQSPITDKLRPFDRHLYVNPIDVPSYNIKQVNKASDYLSTTKVTIDSLRKRIVEIPKSTPLTIKKLRNE